MIETTKGFLPKEMLEMRSGVIDTEVEHTSWIEYWYEGELVHRSAHVQLKQAPAIFATEGSFGG